MSLKCSWQMICCHASILWYVWGLNITICTYHLIGLRSRAIVIEIFWLLHTRANISFLSLIAFFIHGAIIFYFPELYFMHWIGCLATFGYEVCNHHFVIWTKVHNAFYIFPECLELMGVRYPMWFHDKPWWIPLYKIPKLLTEKLNHTWLNLGSFIHICNIN